MPDYSAFVANGNVHAIARGNGLTYIGGDFTELQRQTGGFAALSSSSGTRTGSFPEVDGTVLAVAPDGAGGWFIGGSFQKVAGLTRNRIAHLLPDGSVDPAFNPNANNSVFTLAVSGGAVYAGGSFTQIGGQLRNRIAKLSATSGNAFSGFNPNADNFVESIVVSGSEVFVGGHFTEIGGLPRNRIAKLSATSGNAFSTWNPNASGIVRTLAVSGAAVYVGGDFNGMDSIGGEDRDRIAKLSTTSGDAFSGFDPDADNRVQTIAVSGSEVFAGGLFQSIGGQARSRIAKLSATSGDAFLAWDAGATNAVDALAVSGSEVYVGGDFSGADSIGGEDRNGIAKLSAASGDVFAAFNPNASDDVKDIALSGSTVAIGGQFTGVNGVTRNRIAALDANGVPTSFNPNASGPAAPTVFALAVSGSDVYAAGRFTDIGGLPRNNIAKLSAASGNAFSGWNPGATDIVRALAVSGSGLYVGGDFDGADSIAGEDRDFLAKLSTASGNAFSTWNPGPDDIVRALAVSGDLLFAGGSFDNIGGQARLGLAKLSATSGNVFTTWNAGVNGAAQLVAGLAVSDSQLFVGGSFENLGGATRSSIGKVSVTSGNVFSTWDPNAGGQVNALAPSGSVVYAGGVFTTMGAETRNRLAALSTTSGNPFAAFNPNMSNTVVAVAASPSAVYAGGFFERVGDRPRRGYAQFTEP